MIRGVRHLALSIAIVAVTACDSGATHAPPRGLPHAVATSTCAPNDALAIAIYLTAAPAETMEPSAPYLQITIWHSLDAMDGRTWSLSPDSDDGAASFRATPTGFETATRGSITVRSVSDENRVAGTVDVTFPSAGRIRGTFNATWIPSTRLCG
jgi:hypothetical protein